MDDLVMVARDMATLTQRLSVAVRPDTNEAIEIIEGLLTRLRKGKYDIETRQLVTETKARIQDELAEPRFNASALRANMKTQSAKWTALYNRLSAIAREKKTAEDILTEPTLQLTKVPRTIPAGKSHITFRHQVIFTNKKIISDEMRRKMPPSYQAVEMGSGNRFDNQFIIAVPAHSQVQKTNQVIQDLVKIINSELGKKYVLCHASRDNTTPLFFRIPGSALAYAWIVPQAVANIITFDLRSVTLPDAEIDSDQSAPKPDPDKLKNLRVMFEQRVKSDSELKTLNEERTRLSLLSRPVAAVDQKIRERTDTIRKELREQA